MSRSLLPKISIDKQKQPPYTHAPVKAMSDRGVPAFNAPGANVNAVKELVIAGMLLAARNLRGAMEFVSALDPADPGMEKKVENGKKNYTGFELTGHSLGVIGLGKIGCLVADAAIKNVGNIGQMRPEAILLNFSRDWVVNVRAVLAALEVKELSCYVCELPSPEVNRHPQVIAWQNLGASTGEAEENCAVMVADQLHDYLEHGNVLNAVNFPAVILPRESNYRLAIANANVLNMLGQISTVMAKASLNIHNMINKSKGEVAYTLVDVDSQVPQQVVDLIAAIPGVLAVRYLPLGPWTEG